MTTHSPTAGYCDWLAETIRRATDLRRAGDLPADVAHAVEGHILAALMLIEKSEQKNPARHIREAARGKTENHHTVPPCPCL